MKRESKDSGNRQRAEPDFYKAGSFSDPAFSFYISFFISLYSPGKKTLKFRLITPFLILAAVSSLYSQKYPVAVFEELILQSVKEIRIEAGDKKGFMLKTAFAGDLSLFSNTVESELMPLTSGERREGNEIGYSLLFAGFTHGDVFKSSLFGDYMVERKFEIGGSWSLQSAGKIRQQEFSITRTDTVTLKEYRNSVRANDFGLRGEMPDPPLFEGIFEPVLILGTLASLIAAFFLIRAN